MTKYKNAILHDEYEIQELKADREFAMLYLKEAMAALNDPNERGAGLLAIRSIAQAYGGLTEIAKVAGLSRESLYRSLSPQGNPMQLSAEPQAAHEQSVVSA